jgi:hypothetical protein
MSRHRILFIGVVIAAAIVLAAPRGAAGADPQRGRVLYEASCGNCHSESVHGRAKRVATDFTEVRRWVSRWNESLALRWGDEEIDDVALHLNDTYYRYPCPPSVCKVVSLGHPPEGARPRTVDSNQRRGTKLAYGGRQ